MKDKTKELQHKINDHLQRIASLCIRINVETDLCCFLDISGHVNNLTLTVSTEKENWQTKIHSAKLIYKNYELCQTLEEFMPEFEKDAEQILSDLLRIFNSSWTTKYTVYVNCIEMSTSKTFISSVEAKKYERKMKRKYGKIDAIIGINEERVNQ